VLYSSQEGLPRASAKAGGTRLLRPGPSRNVWRDIVAAKALIAAVIGGILLTVFGQPRAEKMTFGQNPAPLKIPNDISITRVSIEVKGFRIGGFGDYCLGMWRADPPTYAPTMGRGGYIEPLCFNVVRTKSAGDWTQHVDLSETPIFIPAKTFLVC